MLNRKFIIVLLIIFIGIFFSGCKNKQKSIILFNHYPITSDNVLNNSTIFKTEEKIYFVYITKKNLKTEDIRIKIFQRSEKANYGYGSMIYSNDFRLKKGEINYFTDYIVMHSAGNYIMHVYKKDHLWEPDAIADFKVIEH